MFLNVQSMTLKYSLNETRTMLPLSPPILRGQDANMDRLPIEWNIVTAKKLELSEDLSRFSCKNEDDLGSDEFLHEEAYLFRDEHVEYRLCR